MTQKPTYEELEKRVNALQIENDEIRKAKQEIENSEAFHRITLENISDAVIITDDHGKIIYTCPNVTKIFGLSQKQVYDKVTIQEVIKGTACDLSELRKVKEIQNIEWNVLDNSGRERFVLITVKSVTIKDGSVLYVMRDITERKLAELALIDSGQRWRNILINTPQIGISLDPMGKISFANKHFLKLTGWQEETVIGADWFDMFIPEPAREEIRGVFNTIFRKKDASDITGYENDILTRNGELRTIAWSNVLTMDTRGEISDVTCLGIDVSERQRHEKECKESELKYRQLTETMFETFSVVDLNGVFLYANRNAARNLSDGKSDDITGKNIRQFLPENQAEQLIGQYKEVYSSKEPCSQDVLVHLKKGDTWFSNTLKPIDFGLLQVPAVLSVSLDITERKNVEDALHESEAKYRVLFNTFPLGIAISDESGNVIEANDMSTELLGISKDEHQERRIDGPEWRIIRLDGSEMPPDDWASVRALKENGLFANSEMGILKPNGDTIWLSVTAAPIPIEKYGVVVAYNDITDRIEAERKYEMLFREMMDGFALHEIICDANQQPIDYRFLDVNPAFEHLTGLKGESLIGKTVLEVMPKTESYWIKNYGHVALTGKPVFFENYSHELDRYYQVTAFCPSKGKFACILSDITSRKKSEDAIRENEERFRAAFMASPLAIAISLKETGVWIDVNQVALEMFGYMREEIIGNSTLATNLWVKTDDREKIVAELDEYGEVKNYEVQLHRKDGTLMTASVSARKFFMKRREHLLFITEDITDRKRMETALKESEEKYRSMMESMDDAAYICSSGFKIEYMNPSMIKLVGRDATGESCYRAIHGLDEQCEQCDHYKVMQGQTLKTKLIKDDTKETYLVSNSPIYKSNGSVSKLTIYRDITEQKRLEFQIQQAQRIESIGNLAGGIAHDFNNILFPIVGLAEMLSEDLPPGSQERINAQEILHAGQRGADLVKQILAFSRKQEHKLIPTRVQQVIKEVIKLSRSTIPINIGITHNLQQDCGLVLADATQIHQIGMNLITNAYHAVEESSGEISVQVKEVVLSEKDIAGMSISSGKCVMLSIADTGVGIPQTNLKKIFDPYFTTKPQGKGTGLGLAVVYGIVKEHKGDIKVFSEVGKGTTFEVYFPLMVTHEILDPELEQVPVKKGTERILLIDDELPIANLEKQMLERLGYTVTACTSSLYALETFKNSPDVYDLVITDMAMPNMTGDLLARELLSIRLELPIIICSGFSERINKGLAHAIGFKGFLQKPIVKSALASEVRRVLDEVQSANQQ